MVVDEHTWPEVLGALVGGEDLSRASASWAMQQIMQGEASPSQIAGFVMALQAKGVSVDELTGVADEMLAHARLISVDGPTLDIVGTGGDRQNTVNISTMSAVVASAAGAVVVKHGNRAASSKSGAADCLEALGVRLSLGPEGVVETVERTGITFCFAQDFHPSMRHAATTRRELGVPTVFNLLGPLTNPARPRFEAVGVASAVAAPLVAGVFAARGVAAAVFRGRDGLDELTVSGASDVWWVRDGSITTYEIDPVDVGLARHPLEALRGGEPEFNAEVALKVLQGEDSGPLAAVRDAVLLNTGMALAVVRDGESEPVVDRTTFVEAVRRGVEAAQLAITDGSALGRLDHWRTVSRDLVAAR